MTKILKLAVKGNAKTVKSLIAAVKDVIDSYIRYEFKGIDGLIVRERSKR